MQLNRQLPHLGDRGVVDLNFIRGMHRYRARDEQYHRKKQVPETEAHLTYINTRGVTACCL